MDQPVHLALDGVIVFFIIVAKGKHRDSRAEIQIFVAFIVV